MPHKNHYYSTRYQWKNWVGMGQVTYPCSSQNCPNKGEEGEKYHMTKSTLATPPKLLPKCALENQTSPHKLLSGNFFQSIWNDTLISAVISNLTRVNCKIHTDGMMTFCNKKCITYTKSMTFGFSVSWTNILHQYENVAFYTKILLHFSNSIYTVRATHTAWPDES